MTPGRGGMREIYPDSGEAFRYRLEESEGRFTLHPEGEWEPESPAAITLNIELPPGSLAAGTGGGEGLCRNESGRTYPFVWGWAGTELHLWLDGALFVFQRAETAPVSGRRRGNSASAEESGDVLAPMPGAILEVLVAEGDSVERNQTVVVMESMKMELLITAPRDGVVRRVAARPGEQVERGMRLLELAPATGAAG